MTAKGPRPLDAQPVGSSPRLEIRDLCKSFGARPALSSVSLRIAAGEIHGLVGENGSGKSTLVKVLSGYHAPEAGSLWIGGERVHLPLRPAAMRRLGLSVVHQDLGLVDSFTVLENLRVGRFGVRRLSRSIRWQQERALAGRALRALGAQIDLDQPVGGLSVAERAEVAIARALQHERPGRGLVMFDESTRALPPEPRAHFHTLTRRVAERGGSILLVSHRIDEVLAHTDRVSVLRDGRIVASGVPTEELSEHQLIRLMLGHELSGRPARRPAEGVARRTGAKHGRDAGGARVRDLRGRLLAGGSFSVGAGEILGITGLLGSGFEELPYLIGGARRPLHGTLSLGGRTLDLTAARTRELLEAGVALVPEHRDREGLALSCSVQENITLPRVRTRGSVMRIGGWQRSEAEWVVRQLGVRPANPDLPVGHLSGGNQQKVLLGKWLCGEPRLLVLHEPTQGVDVGARIEIERALLGAAQRGCSVILAGMDASELASLCDRVLVMRDGLPAGELVGERSPDRIIDAIYSGVHAHR